jgi:tetratricopeptide (TPR) repeat protein
VGHLETGRGGSQRAWSYHLLTSLPSACGWLGLALAATGTVHALFRPRPETWVLLVTPTVYLTVMGWGHLSFARYALPLVPLALVLASGGICLPSRRLYRTLLCLAALAQPLYGATRTAALLATPDTRSQARTWLEENLAPGSTVCNFGGWAGDVQVRTFEDLWNQTNNYVRYYGADRLKADIQFLTPYPAPPFYSYAIQYGNRHFEAGSLEALVTHPCELIVLHRHPLTYSTIDADFAAKLGQTGKRLAHFPPLGLALSAPLYDPIDAYYIPLSSFGTLRQPGPEIEIWRLDQEQAPPPPPQSAATIFARTNFLGNLVQGRRYRTQGQTDASLDIYRSLLNNQAPVAAESYAQLGLELFKLEERGLSSRAYRRALDIDPEHLMAQLNLGWNFYLDDDFVAAETAFRQVLSRQAHALAQFNLGLTLLSQGQQAAAESTYAQGVHLFGADTAVRLGAVDDLRAQGKRAESILDRFWP